MVKFVVLILAIAVHLEFGQCGSPLEVLNILGGPNKPAPCNCVETALAEMPSSAQQCSESSFINGLSEKLATNNNRINKELRGHKCDCKFDDVEAALQRISAKIKKIIKILNDCNRDEKMLNAAIDRYDQLKKVYNAAVRQATASQSSECGSILARIRPILFNSAENIMAAVLKCIQFKSA